MKKTYIQFRFNSAFISRHDGNEQTCYYREKKVPLLHSVFLMFLYALLYALQRFLDNLLHGHGGVLFKQRLDNLG